MEQTISSNEQDLNASLAYPWYIVSLCMLAYIFSFIDRQVITLLIEPIRADLQISDTEFSLLHGLAFAMLYAVAGIPIARMADSRSRPAIISVGIFVWSFATAACGTAKNFVQLFLARMVVGVGEAALSPAAYSMITDSFPKSKLGLALGVYSSGSFLGGGLAFIIGGAAIALVEQWGPQTFPVIGLVKPWQMTFFMVGLPGLVVAALFYFTVKDPDRKGVANDNSAFSFSDVLRYIGEHKATFAAHYLGFGFMSLALFALMNWAPAYFLRKYGMSVRDVGLSLGLVVLIGNSAGVLVSGWLTDRLTRKGYRDAPMRAGMIGSMGVVIPAALFSQVTGFGGSLALLAVAMFFASFPLATSATALQLMAPNRMRAQVTALFFLSMNILGITGGTTLVALSTDFIFQNDKLVGYSMSLISVSGAVLGAIMLGWGLKHFVKTEQEVAAQVG
ncbi:MAG: MFS transporter [Proteobacteria bacterium]|nr:MFS transporter [Pseudomonadota bacterium]